MNQSLVAPALKALVLIKFQAISILLTTVDDYETNELEILKWVYNYFSICRWSVFIPFFLLLTVGRDTFHFFKVPSHHHESSKTTCWRGSRASSFWSSKNTFTGFSEFQEWKLAKSNIEHDTRVLCLFKCFSIWWWYWILKSTLDTQEKWKSSRGKIFWIGTELCKMCIQG